VEPLQQRLRWDAQARLDASQALERVAPEVAANTYLFPNLGLDIGPTFGAKYFL
jgi:hypothetical protein